MRPFTSYPEYLTAAATWAAELYRILPPNGGSRSNRHQRLPIRSGAVESAAKALRA